MCDGNLSSLIGTSVLAFDPSSSIPLSSALKKREDPRSRSPHSSPFSSSSSSSDSLTNRASSLSSSSSSSSTSPETWSENPGGSRRKKPMGSPEKKLGGSPEKKPRESPRKKPRGSPGGSPDETMKERFCEGECQEANDRIEVQTVADFSKEKTRLKRRIDAKEKALRISAGVLPITMTTIEKDRRKRVKRSLSIFERESSENPTGERERKRAKKRSSNRKGDNDFSSANETGEFPVVDHRAFEFSAFERREDDRREDANEELLCTSFLVSFFKSSWSTDRLFVFRWYLQLENKVEKNAAEALSETALSSDVSKKRSSGTREDLFVSFESELVRLLCFVAFSPLRLTPKATHFRMFAPLNLDERLSTVEREKSSRARDGAPVYRPSFFCSSPIIRPIKEGSTEVTRNAFFELGGCNEEISVEYDCLDTESKLFLVSLLESFPFKESFDVKNVEGFSNHMMYSVLVEFTETLYYHLVNAIKSCETASVAYGNLYEDDEDDSGDWDEENEMVSGAEEEKEALAYGKMTTTTTIPREAGKKKRREIDFIVERKASEISWEMILSALHIFVQKFERCLTFRQWDIFDKLCLHYSGQLKVKVKSDILNHYARAFECR